MLHSPLRKPSQVLIFKFANFDKNMPNFWYYAEVYSDDKRVWNTSSFEHETLKYVKQRIKGFFEVNSHWIEPTKSKNFIMGDIVEHFEKMFAN